MNIISNILLIIFNIFIYDTLCSHTTYYNVLINYDETKGIVQNCLNGVLNTLYLNEQVTQKPKVQLLLIIHNNYNSVVKHKWKLIRDIKIITKVEKSNITQEVYEFVEEAVIAMKTDNLSNETERKSIEMNLNNSKSSDFFAELINKINKQSVVLEEISKISLEHVDKEDISEEVNGRRMNDVYNMQTWQPAETNITRRVYGGKIVGVSEYPFVVSVHVLGKFSCSGSIVSSSYVITAASCLQPGRMYKASKRPIEIRIGSDNANEGGKLLPALEVIFHPKYDPVNLKNNLAMIKVKNILHVNKKLKKIRMDSNPTDLPRDINSNGVSILGWGDGKKDKQCLTSARLDLQSLEDCIDIYTKQYVTDKNFCAGIVYKGSGACNGDIGGPAVVLGTLIGVVSFGPPTCGTVSDPTVFTRVGYYATWINNVLNGTIPKSQPSDHLWLSDTALFSQPKSLLRSSYEEMFLLKQLIEDIEKSDNKMSKIIEEDKELDDEMKMIFQSTTTVDASHHLLLNKSIVIIPGLHIASIPTVAPMVTEKVTAPIIDIGLPDLIPYEQVNDMISDSTELRYYIDNFLKKGTIFKSDYGMLDSDEKDELTLQDTSENFEYESDEGMSIEVPPGFVKDKYDKTSIEISTKKHKKTTKNDEITIFDLGDHQNTFNIVKKPGKRSTMQPKDIWLEVMQLKESKNKKGVTTESSIYDFNNIIVRNGQLVDELESYLSNLDLTK